MPVEAFKAAKVLDSYKGDLTGLPVGEIKDKSKKQKTTVKTQFVSKILGTSKLSPFIRRSSMQEKSCLCSKERDRRQVRFRRN